MWCGACGRSRPGWHRTDGFRQDAVLPAARHRAHQRAAVPETRRWADRAGVGADARAGGPDSGGVCQVRLHLLDQAHLYVSVVHASLSKPMAPCLVERCGLRQGIECYSQIALVCFVSVCTSMCGGLMVLLRGVDDPKFGSFHRLVTLRRIYCRWLLFAFVAVGAPQACTAACPRVPRPAICSVAARL